MRKAFYRKYRSKSLSEVVGQSHITDVLSRALKEGKVAHAYLFTGPRGVGKTSIARILAHEINGLPYQEDEPHLDIIEIDAASNNGVEDIRELRERVQLAPVSAKKKVYIIDEVHMLSKAAFNALLKTLEEPPEHIVFILATTDADKLPDTIVSRTQRFNFRTISTKDVVGHLAWIAEQEGFKADETALELIATHGEGSFRDSIGLLDQLHSAADEKTGVTKELVEAFLGLPPQELVDKLLSAYEAGDVAVIVSLLDEAEGSGAQPVVIAAELIRAIRANVAKKPQLLPLLDALLDVAHSSRPDIKLLTTLAAPASLQVPLAPSKPKTAALASLRPTISTPVPEKKPAASKPAEAEVAEEVAEEAADKPEKTVAAAAPADFDWNKLLQHIQANHVAIFAVLSKCTPEVAGGKLTLYTVNGFYKKKLDDVRYRSTLIESLATLGMDGLLIETVGTPPPPKDAVAATVAALMGGGEEYIVNEEPGEQE